MAKWHDDMGLKLGYDLDEISSGRMRERTDEVGFLLSWLRPIVLRLRRPQDTHPLSGTLIALIIRALERVPLSRGTPRALGPLAKALERVAREEALKRKRELRAGGMSATEAELQASEEAVPIFRRITGRTLESETIRGIMQRKSPRKPRRKNPGTKSAD